MKKLSFHQASITELIITCFLFLFSCDSDEDPITPNLDSVGFDISISGSTSRDIQGTNASYKFLQMPNGFATTHQLAIYLIDEDGYVVTATILLNGPAALKTGTYAINNLLNRTFEEFDSSVLFGQNGGLSHTSAAAGGGNIIITESGSDFIKGTLDGGLRATTTGSGDINIKGSFYAQLDE